MKKVSNEDVLASLNYPPESEEYRYALVRMTTYGEKRWWLLTNPCERAYWQTQEWYEVGVLLLQTREQYRLDLGTLTGRTFPDVFIEKRTDLRATVRVAYVHYLKSQGRVAEQKQVCESWDDIPFMLSMEKALAERGVNFFTGGEWAVAEQLDPASIPAEIAKTEEKFSFPITVFLTGTQMHVLWARDVAPQRRIDYFRLLLQKLEQIALEESFGSSGESLGYDLEDLQKVLLDSLREQKADAMAILVLSGEDPRLLFVCSKPEQDRTQLVRLIIRQLVDNREHI